MWWWYNIYIYIYNNIYYLISHPGREVEGREVKQCVNISQLHFKCKLMSHLTCHHYHCVSTFQRILCSYTHTHTYT